MDDVWLRVLCPAELFPNMSSISLDFQSAHSTRSACQKSLFLEDVFQQMIQNIAVIVSRTVGCMAFTSNCDSVLAFCEPTLLRLSRCSLGCANRFVSLLRVSNT